MSAIIKSAVSGSTENGDCYIEISPNASGLNVDIHSTLILQFGDKIKQTVNEVLSDCGVQNATVMIDDHGALDWILRARLETAVGRAKEEAK